MSGLDDLRRGLADPNDDGTILGHLVASGQAEIGVSGVGPGVTSHINVYIKNTGDAPLNVSIPAGTNFVSQVPGYQNHPVTEDMAVTVPPGAGNAVTVTVPSL